MFTSTRSSTLARVALVVLVLTGCGRGVVPLSTTTPVLLAAQTDPELLRAAIVRALDARRFTTESETPGRIVARMSSRGQMLGLAVDYSATDYRITYLDSQGLGYRVGADGQAMISRHYDRRVAQLRQTIESELERPEREAREAVEEQRQHELAVVQAQRQREQDARDAEAREHERDRRAVTERERLRTEQERLRTQRAQAEVEARRPIIVNHDAYVVGTLELAPRRAAQARFETARVRRGVRPRWLNGQAEGRVDAAQLGLPESCRGFFAGTPEHVIEVSRDMDYLRLETDSDEDPTLVVVASDGAVYCDDDGGEGLNSRIEGSFPSGTYRVFVGSYRQGTSATYRLLVTNEAAIEAPAPRRATVTVGPTAPATVAAPPDCRSILLELGHSPSGMVHCSGAEPYCAEAVLRAGHSPSSLVHCQDVEPQCAQGVIRAGHSPSSLVHCRR